jgi:glucosamine--fructose-6-phosphate aminotransferase (isomerizing)
VTEANAHPHFDNSDRVHIALNGIIENHVALRRELAANGADFTSETDAEVVAHLIGTHYDGDLVQAVIAARRELSGHYAFVAMCAEEPGVVVGSRSECPLVVGVGEEETFLASAIPAFLDRTTTVRHVGDDQIVVIRPGAVEAFDADGVRVELDELEIDWDEGAAELEGFETFMAKEIHEQADAVASAT